MIRRRPLLRAAVVGGGAYAMGKRSAAQEAQYAEPQYDPAAQAPPPQAPPQQAPAAESDMTERLSKLATLHQQGVLTDEEFAMAKAKLLSG